MTELKPDWGTKLDARFSKMEQDAKRALRWAERLFGRVKAIEADIASDLISIRALRKTQKELAERVTTLENERVLALHCGILERNRRQT